MVPRSGLMGPTYKFTRWCDISNVYATTDGSATGVAVTAVAPDTIYQGLVTLNLLPNQSDFTNLFSQFKITELEYHFINTVMTDVDVGQTTGILNSAGLRNVPVYILAQNDPLNVASIQQLQQEANVIIRTYTNDGKPFILKVKKPTYYGSATDGTLIVSNAEERNGWLDTQTAAGVQYRGMCLAIQDAFKLCGTPASAFTLMSGRVKMTLEFRGVR